MARGHGRVHLRSGERGAAVFVVMMAILVITSMGTWAIYSASLTSTGTGYQRAAAQTLYAAELGVLAGTGVLSIPGMANAQIVQARADLGENDPDDCLSASSTEFCKSIYMEDLDLTIQAETAGMGESASTFDILQIGTASEQGSMGPYASGDAGALQGHFILELTDERPANLPGMDLDTGKENLPQYRQVTLTSYGTVRPSSGDLCSAAETASAGQIAMRAHVVVGPIAP